MWLAARILLCSTYAALQYHIVFSTKNRVPLIEPDWRQDLHGYVGGTVRGLGGVPLAIGGVADPVHLLVGTKPSHCVAGFVREVKKASSLWADSKIRRFAWQEGYAAFTVSYSGVEGVRSYVLGQAEHHKKVGSRDELLALLEENGVEFDIRYFV